MDESEPVAHEMLKVRGRLKSHRPGPFAIKELFGLGKNLHKARIPVEPAIVRV
jgi:hypothetical protein